MLSTLIIINSSLINSDNPKESPNLITEQDQVYPSVFELDESDKRWIENTLSDMSLYQKCAQMIMIPVYRSYMDTASPDYADVINLVRNTMVGGIIMFQGELKQEIEFIKSMQKISSIPLLVASDFERGPGTRIDDALEFPHGMSLGATLNSQYAYDMGKAIAEESRLVGVHQNFAPVADINNNALNPVINVRSFSESKFTVANFVSSFVLGTKHGRMISTAKHFPGHGNTEIDSHTDLPMITGDKKYLLDNELYPFIEAIRTGVHSIMVGHLEVPVYDSLPASISKKIITDLLINTLGFDGIVVTDALNMDGINKEYTVEDITLLAVKAGNDIILMPPDPLTSISTIYKAVLENDISEERIDKSVRKILAAKRWLKIYKEPEYSVDEVVDKLEDLNHLQLAEEIASASITLIKNKRGIIPVTPLDYKNISCITITDAEGGETAKYFGESLDDRIGNIQSFVLTRNSSTNEYQSVYNSVKNADLIFFPIFHEVEPEIKSEKLEKRQNEFINKILRLKAPSIVISFKNPYLLFSQKKVKTFLNVYSYTEVSQDATLRAILGEEYISGRLPVSIPNSEFNIGHGLSIDKSINTELSFAETSQIDFNNLDDLILKAIIDEDMISAEIGIGKEGKLLHQKSFGTAINKSSTNKQNDGTYYLHSLALPVALTSTKDLI
jgi:beta-glucosidase-like glycosyl hydrolase